MKPKKYLPFIVYELIYLLMTDVVLGVACYLQFLRKYIIRNNTGTTFLTMFTDTYSYDFFAYFIGLLVFIEYAFFSYRVLFSSHSLQELFRKVPHNQASNAWDLIMADCFILALELFVISFRNLGFNSLSPLLLNLFTIIGWPLIIAFLSRKKYEELVDYRITHSTKSDIREAVLMQRNALSDGDIALKSEIIFNKLSDTPEYKEAENILVYASTGSEVSTDAIIQRCLAEGKKVFCPKVIDKENRLMKFIQINSTVDLVSGFHGIREPEISDSSVIYPEQEDTSQGTLVIMPGVAFDHYRNRIGYNGGFYDTFLEKHKEISKIAIAFQVQISDRIIVPEDHDIKPDLIITEFSQYAV